jgi:hypothetical protein
MAKVVKAGAMLMYVDTDSVIYKFHKDEGDPLTAERGSMLGTLSDEYPNHTIVEFLSSGNKSYCMKLRNNSNGDEEFIMKSKGITLDHTTCKCLNYIRFKEAVLNYMKNEEIPMLNLQYNKIKADKTGHIYTQLTSKMWRPLITKGNVVNDGTIIPYGFVDPNNEKSIESYYNFLDSFPQYEKQFNEPNI